MTFRDFLLFGNVAFVFLNVMMASHNALNGHKRMALFNLFVLIPNVVAIYLLSR